MLTHTTTHYVATVQYYCGSELYLPHYRAACLFIEAFLTQSPLRGSLHACGAGTRPSKMNSPEPASLTATVWPPSLTEANRCSPTLYHTPEMPPDDDGSATTPNRVVIITFTFAAMAGVVLALLALSTAAALCYSIIHRKRESHCVIV